MNTQYLQKLIADIAIIHPNDDFALDKLWTEITDILSDNVCDTIHFFENECTDEELYWLGPVLEDIAEKTQSQELLKVIRTRLADVTYDSFCKNEFISDFLQNHIDYTEYVRSISSDIEFAEARITNLSE